MSKQLTLNQKYLQYLSKYPLLTKSVTAAVLAVLNETIATSIAKDFKISTVFNQKIKHPLSWKLPIFAIFAAGISTPVTHYGLKWINSLFKAPLTGRKKLLQILTVLLTYSPLLNVLFVSFVSLINLKPQLQSFSRDELKRALSGVQTSLKKSLFSVIKSSWITTPIVLTICQNYLDPEYWTVFSNFVYFILGTGQNTLLKLKSKQSYQYQKKRDEVDEKVNQEIADKSATDLSIIEAPSEELKSASSESSQ